MFHVAIHKMISKVLSDFSSQYYFFKQIKQKRFLKTQASEY